MCLLSYLAALALLIAVIVALFAICSAIMMAFDASVMFVRAAIRRRSDVRGDR